MNAVTATADMNRIYRHQRHIYDLTRRYYLLGRDELIENLNAGSDSRVLEIGCGTGRNLIVAARRYPNARLYGVDVSTEMLTSARESIERGSLSTSIRVAHGDATLFDPRTTLGVDRFERIFLSYTASMIPRWQSAVDHAISLLSPRGELHIVDFGGQAGWPGFARRGLRRWLSAFHVTPRDDLESALQERAVDRGARLLFERRFRDYAQYARLILPG